MLTGKPQMFAFSVADQSLHYISKKNTGGKK